MMWWQELDECEINDCIWAFRIKSSSLRSVSKDYLCVSSRRTIHVYFPGERHILGGKQELTFYSGVQNREYGRVMI